jgi:hypothetical protein
LSNPTGGTTTSFAEGSSLSKDLRATDLDGLQAMTARLEEISRTAKDYVGPGTSLSVFEGGVEVDDGPQTLRLGIRGVPAIGLNMAYDLGRIAHEQLGEKLGIPRSYYTRMAQEAPSLLVKNLNHWFQNSTKNYMVRTLDERVRAIVSDRYRVLDGHTLALHSFREAQAAGAKVQRMDLSDERLYIRMLLPDYAMKITGRAADLKSNGGGVNFAPGYKNDSGKWQGPDDDDPNGDWIFAAAIVSNSDVGRGGLNVEVAAFRCTCDNFIMVSQSLHKVHLGGRMEGGLQLSDSTKDLKDKAIWGEVTDMIRAAFNPDQFRAMVENMNEAKATLLTDPVEAIDAVVADNGLTDEDKQAILNGLLADSGNSSNVWGLLNAVTVQAHTTGIEKGVDFERIGGAILANPREFVGVKVGA